MRYILLLLPALLVLTACTGGVEQSAEVQAPAMEIMKADPFGENVGTVNFPVSCNDTAAAHMERGVALLHHMTYTYADKTFEAAIEADPECAMGYWGRAMTIIHPLWPDIPDEEKLKRGLELINEAKALGTRTPREDAYIAAVKAYFEDGLNRSESERLMSFEQGWKSVYENFPDDNEAAAFYALAHMATATAEDKTYTKQKEAGAIVEKLLAEVPDHPGAHHYIIHAYDLPPLAERALDVARGYGNIAPDVPHALHMPTHIFTRLGLWQESVEWNIRSADAALKQSREQGGIVIHYTHALDYLAYAYLQQGRYNKAMEVRDTTVSIEGPFHGLNLAASAYALAAIPARCQLERHNWSGAAKLEPRVPASFPWDERFAPYEAITYFARALGSARSGDLDAARAELEKLTSLGEHVIETRSDSYWSKQVEIQRLAVTAWIAYEEGKPDEAVRTMAEAADIESAVEKVAVSPGEVLPAREMLGDMLMLLDRPKEALEAYETSLARSPNRLNSLYGAGRAAEAAGDGDKAADYYGKLLQVTVDSDTDLEELKHAEEYLATI